VPERDRQAPCAAPLVQAYIASVRLVGITTSCETIQSQEPTMRPTGRRVTSSRRDGKTGRKIREHALSINSVPLAQLLPRQANL
jgi:hypothetical protein